MPRYAQLLTSADILSRMFTHGCPGFVPVKNHLPSDAKLVGAYTAHPGIVGLIFESTAYPETTDETAAMLPVIPDIYFQNTNAAAVCPSRLAPSDN